MARGGGAACSPLPGDARGSPWLRCAWSWCFCRDFPQLFRGHSVKRRHGDPEYAQISVKFATVMNLMLRHGAQEFPHGHGCSVSRGALAPQALVAEAGKDVHGLGVHAVHELDHLIVTIGHLPPTSRVAIASAGHGLGKNISLHGSDVARQIAEAEFVFPATPLQLCGWNTRDQPHGTRAYFLKI